MLRDDPKKRPKKDYEFDTSCCKSQFQVANVYLDCNVMEKQTANLQALSYCELPVPRCQATTAMAFKFS